MHRCFEIPELVLQIIEACVPGYKTTIWTDKLDRSSAYSLALTSRVFLEPALDIIWYSQHDIGNLLNLIGTESWRVKSCTDDLSILKEMRRAEFVDSANAIEQWVRPFCSVWRQLFDQLTFLIRS